MSLYLPQIYVQIYIHWKTHLFVPVNQTIQMLLDVVHLYSNQHVLEEENRRIAAAAIAASQELTCPICYEDFPENEGIKCSADHFQKVKAKQKEEQGSNSDDLEVSICCDCRE